jgi:hypothetical protein
MQSDARRGAGVTSSTVRHLRLDGRLGGMLLDQNQGLLCGAPDMALETRR